MHLGLITILLQLLLTQVGIATDPEGRKYVDLVMSIDEYYEAANSNNSYTMVEFTTSWCHHCKQLKPNFLQLANSYDNDTATPPVKFLEVNCEVFGTTICRDMPGFPMIYLIQPRVKDLVFPEIDHSLPLWRKIWAKIYSRIEDPKWQLDKERIIDYNGKRDFVSMRNFIESVRTKDRLALKAANAIEEDYDCGDDALCLLGRTYVGDTLNKLSAKQLGQERFKLESILKNADDGAKKEAVELVKLKLEILNQFDNDNEEQNLHDEL